MELLLFIWQNRDSSENTILLLSICEASQEYENNNLSSILFRERNCLIFRALYSNFISFLYMYTEVGDTFAIFSDFNWSDISLHEEKLFSLFLSVTSFNTSCVFLEGRPIVLLFGMTFVLLYSLMVLLILAYPAPVKFRISYLESFCLDYFQKISYNWVLISNYRCDI